MRDIRLYLNEFNNEEFVSFAIGDRSINQVDERAAGF
jgi:hypothetical protein